MDSKLLIVSLLFQQHTNSLFLTAKVFYEVIVPLLEVSLTLILPLKMTNN